LHHDADADRAGADDAGGFDLVVRGNHLAGIHRIFDDAVKAEQLGEAGAVQRPDRVGHHAGPHRAEIQAAIGFADALLVALEGLFVGQQVMTVGDRHRLNTVGVSRHQGVQIIGRLGQKLGAQAEQVLREIQRLVAQLRGAIGGIHVLPAAPGMNHRRLFADMVGHDPFDLQNVAGTLAAGLLGLADGVVDALGDQLTDVLGEDAFFHQHDGGGLVDLVEPVNWSSFASVALVWALPSTGAFAPTLAAFSLHSWVLLQGSCPVSAAKAPCPINTLATKTLAAKACAGRTTLLKSFIFPPDRTPVLAIRLASFDGARARPAKPGSPLVVRHGDRRVTALQPASTRIAYSGWPIDTFSVPTPSTPHSILSPGLSCETPAGVPVMMMSPAASPTCWESCQIISGTFQISSVRSPFCVSVPFTVSQILPFEGWPIFEAGCIAEQGAE